LGLKEIKELPGLSGEFFFALITGILNNQFEKNRGNPESEEK